MDQTPLSNRTRRSILGVLRDEGPVTHIRVAERLDADPSLTWRNLHLMAISRLVSRTGVGADSLWKATGRPSGPLFMVAPDAHESHRLNETRPADDDPDVLDALRVWENLLAKEQATVFRSIWQHVVAFARTLDQAHLVYLADMLAMMIYQHSDGLFIHQMRGPFIPPAPEDVLTTDETRALIASLRGETGDAARMRQDEAPPF